ncbi:MAG TPA: family 78 glycoside hydrolase catalytic domain [Chitinophagaceae bacterium]|nr:family 78 glycoside hydrolase catalytic domain [Chitinophagaceae bacterium]
MKHFKLFVACIILLQLNTLTAFSQIQITSALCENKVNPLGVALQGLHFSWEMTSAEQGQYQTAYQLVISSSLNKLRAGNYDVYNSAKVPSSQSIMVKAGDKTFAPAQTCYWKVCVWDKQKVPVWSDTHYFTTGIFEQKDWQNARWIGYEDMPDSMRVVPGIHAPYAETLGNKCVQRPVIPLLRKQFTVKKKASKALLFITGLGQYEATINGTRTANSFLSPGWTYYDKTVLYNTYDVTGALLNGNNTIGVIAGNGFYNINRERYFKIVTAFGMPKMKCLLKIMYDDGSTENIVSDESWKTAPSPISFSSIYGGEDYDARLEQKGWNTNTFSDAAWKKALLVKAPEGKLLPQQDYPVAIMDSFKVKKIWQPVKGIFMYDFGQNVSGIIRLKVKGKKGQVVKLVPAELLDAKQLANQDASGSPFYFTYTLKGDGEEEWQPKFTYYGFRYVQVEGAAPAGEAGATNNPSIVQITSLHNRNSNPVNGTFECSNNLFNRIYTLINWAIKSNMQSVVTDCPHREKLSWLEQDYLMGASIHYNYDVYSLYRQLVFDLLDAQYPQGLIPDIAPEYVVFEGGFLDSPEWGSSGVILPWLLYSWYGDADILAKAYPMAKKYVDYLTGRSNNYILSYGLGDWFDYGPREPGLRLKQLQQHLSIIMMLRWCKKWQAC